MKGKFLIFAGLAITLYFLFFYEKKNDKKQSNNGDDVLGQLKFNGEGVRVPHFYAVANENNTPLFIMDGEGIMRQQSATLDKGQRVSVLEMIGGYYKIDCDGIYVEKNKVTKEYD